MTDQRHSSPEADRAAAMNLGPATPVSDAEQHREHEVAATINPAGAVPDEAPGSERHGQGPTPGREHHEHHDHPGHAQHGHTHPTPPADDYARTTVEGERAEGARAAE